MLRPSQAGCPGCPPPAAGPGLVPCPPMLSPAFWMAAPHRPARHGSLESGTGWHLGTRGYGGAMAAWGLPPGQASSAVSLLLPEEPSGGLTGLSPGLESETDFWESTVARSCNPDRLAGQCCSRHRPSWSCHQPTYLDPFRACVQGVAPAAPATGHTAQAATAVPACQQEGAASASASPA